MVHILCRIWQEEVYGISYIIYGGKNTGSTIISELTDYLKSIDYLAIRLAWAKGNPQAEHFWLKNGFTAIKETTSTAAAHVILAEKKL